MSKPPSASPSAATGQSSPSGVLPPPATGADRDAARLAGAKALFDAVLATGASEQEAHSYAVQGYGRKVVRDALRLAVLADLHRPNGQWVLAGRVLERMDVLARQVDVTLATQVLDVWIAQAGPTVKVRGHLNLDGSGWLDRLPDGLAIEGYLSLKGTAIQVLPERLQVGTNALRASAHPESLGLRPPPPSPGPVRDLWNALVLTGCFLWDGQVPASAQVGGYLFTDRHPHGIRLDEWRGHHPRGER